MVAVNSLVHTAPLLHPRSEMLAWFLSWIIVDRRENSKSRILCSVTLFYPSPPSLSTLETSSRHQFPTPVLTSFLLIFHNCSFLPATCTDVGGHAGRFAAEQDEIHTSDRHDCNLHWLSIAAECENWAGTSIHLGRRSEDRHSLCCFRYTQHRRCQHEWLFFSITIVLCNTAVMFKCYHKYRSCHTCTSHSYQRGFSKQTCKQSQTGPFPDL